MIRKLKECNSNKDFNSEELTEAWQRHEKALKHFYFSKLAYFIQDGNFSRPCQFCHFRNFCQGANFGCCTIFVSHCKQYLSHIARRICPTLSQTSRKIARNDLSQDIPIKNAFNSRCLSFEYTLVGNIKEQEREPPCPMSIFEIQKKCLIEVIWKTSITIWFN